MLTKVFVGVGLGLLGTYVYFELSERSGDHAATVVLEQKVAPSSSASSVAPEANVSVPTADAAREPPIGAGSAEVVVAAPEGSVLPELLPETRAMLVARPAIDLLIGNARPVSNSFAPAQDAPLADRPTSSIVVGEERQRESLEIDGSSDQTEAEVVLGEALQAAVSPTSDAINSVSRDDLEQASRSNPSEEASSERAQDTVKRVVVRMMTIDVGMVALRSAPSSDALISGTAQRGDMLTAVPVEGSNWMLVQDARSGVIGYLPRTVLKDILR